MANLHIVSIAGRIGKRSRGWETFPSSFLAGLGELSAPNIFYQLNFRRQPSMMEWMRSCIYLNWLNQSRSPARLLLAVLALCSVSSTAQDADKPSTAYVDAGIGVYGKLGKSNPNYNVDAGADLNRGRLLAEIEGGADTANASGSSSGYTFRAHGLLLDRIKTRWLIGAGAHYSEFSSTAFKKHDLWPTIALMYDRDWLRANFQYLLPGLNSDYRETGPLVDLRLRIFKSFYYRQRTAVLFYRDALEIPPGRHVGSEVTFGVMYVFHDREH